MSDFRLKVFSVVAKELSFTKASQILHISQPAISKHIKELEGLYGLALFERKGSGIELTLAGERLLILADDLLERYRELDAEMHLFKGDVKGELRVGASTTIAQYVIAGILARFVERYKDVKVSLISGNSEQIEQALSEHKIDVGLVEGNSKKREFHYQHFANDELVLVTKVENNCAQEIEIEQLKALPLILRESGSGTLDVLMNIFSNHNIKFSDLDVVIQLGSTESIKQYLLNSNSFAFLSIVSVINELISNKLKVVDILEVDIVRQFSIITIQGVNNDLSNRFIEFSKLNYNKKL